MVSDDDTDYLMREERFSHYAGFDNADVLRRNCCWVLVINGLRDINRQVKLMVKHGLDSPKARSVASRAVDALAGN